MTISSRSPEGAPGHCPVCDALLGIEPSDPCGDAACPQCGTLLWFCRTASGIWFHDIEKFSSIRERVIEIVCEDLGVYTHQVTESMSFIQDIGADTLDILELVMDLEEEFKITIPNEEAEKIGTVGQLIDWILRDRERRRR